MTNHDVVIIGGGIAGLAAGSYLQMNGYRTVVLEMGGCCGGVSVSWRRSGYVFDGATNWLPGATPASNLHGMLAELIDFSQLPLSSTDVFIQAENNDAVFTVYKDADRLAGEMLRLGPRDGARIRAFTNAIKLASTLAIPYEKSPESMSVIDKLSFLVKNAKLIAFMARWRGTTIHSFARRFESQSLRDLFPQIFPHHEFFSMFGLLMSLGWMHARGEAYPLGGSERFAEVMRQRYERLGGTVLVNKRVEGIDIVSGEARGVRCADGSTFSARHIVSAIDAHGTHHGLLKGKYLDAVTRQRFSSWRVFPSLVQVSLGVTRAFPPDSPKLSCPLSVPLQMGSERSVNMLVRVCSFDPSFAPPGKTAIVVHLRTSDCRYWVDLRTRDRDLYRAEKDRVARAVIDALDKRLGGIRDAVDAIDVATPATIIRYTGNWQGSYQGWAPTPHSVGALLPSTIKGLRGFYLTGHWLWPGGGLPAVIRVSRQAVQKICASDGKRFITRPAAGSTPEIA